MSKSSSEASFPCYDVIKANENGAPSELNSTSTLEEQQLVNVLIPSLRRDTATHNVKQNPRSVMKDSEVSVSTPSTTSSPSPSSSKPLVAGPQQKQRLQREDNKYLQDEDFGEMFLRLANIHQDLRKLLGCYDFDISQPVIKIMKAYTSLCRDELEGLKLAVKCRRLAQHMSRTMDLLHNISSSLEDTFEYKHRMIELVSIYVSCELKCAKEFKDRKLIIANCILHNIYKYLNAPKKDDTTSYILRMFTYMANMYSEREVMANIFQTIIPKKLVIVQRELPDRLYIQYLIVFYHWQQLQLVHEDKMSVIQFANNFMRPSKTLCTNAMYAYHLPKYTSLHTATQYILQNLKFFHDLRNASIYDNRLNTDSGFLDISEDSEQSYSTGTVNINFVKLVENSVTRPALRPMIKLESQVVIATIDLTIEDTEESAHYEQDSHWVHGLQRNATKMQPGLSSLMITSQNRAALSESEIIQIESDNGEESNVLCLDDEPLSVEESAEYNEPVNVESNDLNHTENLLHKGIEKVYNNDVNLSSGGTAAVTASVTSTSTSAEEVSRLEKIIPNSPTLNITSVRSIALTPPNNKNTLCGIVPINKPINYQLSTSSELDTSEYFKRNSKIYSHSTTQTDINDCTYTTASDSTTQESGFFQTLSDKPNIIEVRSIERSQNHCNKNANIGEAQVIFAVDSDSTQVNKQTARVISSTVSNDQSDLTPKEPSLNDESYMCRRNSLHINSSPIDPNEAASKDVNAEEKSHMEENHGKNDLLSFRRSTPEVLLKIPISTASSVSTVRKVPNNEGVEDTNCKIIECSNSKTKEHDVDTFNSSKVVYSVNKIQVQRESTKLISTDYDSNEMQNPPKPNKKKLVQFTNQPMGRQRCTGIQYPIKPAIKQTAKSSINIQHTTFNTCSDVALFGRNPSLTYKKSRLIKKERYKSIPEEFSRYYSGEKIGVSRPKINGLPRQTLPDFLKKCVQKPKRRRSFAQAKERNFMKKSVDLQTGLNTLPQQMEDEKLTKKCCVVIKQHKALNIELIKYTNDLLERQRQNVEQKRRDEERQRILNEKLIEEQMLKQQIMELKRQQAEKIKYRAEKLQKLQKDNQSLVLQKEPTRKPSSEQALPGVNVGQQLTLQPSSELRIQTLAKPPPTALPSAQVNDTTVGMDENLSGNDGSGVGPGCEETFEGTRTPELASTDTVSQMKHQDYDEQQLVNETMADKKQEDTGEEELNIVPSPTAESFSDVETMSYLITKPVKVRIKRAWRQERIKRKLKSIENVCETQTPANTKSLTEAEKRKKSEEKEETFNAVESDKEDQLPISVEQNVTSFDQPKIGGNEKECLLPGENNGGGLSSSLTMLANTAVRAAVAEMQALLPAKEKLKEPTTSLGVAPSRTQAASQHGIGYNNGYLANDEDDGYLSSAQQTPVFYDSSELPTSSVAAATNNDIPKRTHLTLINIEATPTVPPYLFNGESRDVSTPTPTISSISEQVDVAKETAIGPVDLSQCKSDAVNEMTATPVVSSHVLIENPSTNTNPTAAVPIVSTSDQEVSSTQESLCENIRARFINQGCDNSTILLSSSVSLPTSSSLAKLPKAAVQNNQIDTTHEIPESTSNRSSCRLALRRTRELATVDDLMVVNRMNDKQSNQPPHTKRRKTICGTDELFQSHASINSFANEYKNMESAPSTTTVETTQQPTGKKRGRSKKTSAQPTTKLIGVTKETTKKAKKITSERTPSSNIFGNVASAVTIKSASCSSPSLEKHSNALIKHTYSTDNVVKNVFVPPEIEECLKQDNLGESKSSAGVGTSNSTSTKAEAKNDHSNTKSSKCNSTNSALTAAIKNAKDKNIFKTLEGARLKILHTRKEKERAAAVVAAAAAAVGAASVASPEKKKSVKTGRRR